MTHLLFSVFIGLCWGWLAYCAFYKRQKSACIWISALIGWQIFKSTAANQFLAGFLEGLGL